MCRASANKNVLSSRLNLVLGKCLAVTVQWADCSTAVVWRPQNFYRRALTVYNVQHTVSARGSLNTRCCN